MRKFLTALLAVMMLVAVAVPVAAADEPERTSDFDGTTALYSGPQYLSLVVTEMMSNSTNNTFGWVGDQLAPHYDAFTYLEVYNRGTEPVDLTEVALVSYLDSKTIDDAGQVTHEFYSGKYEKKFSINAGSIYTGISGLSASVTNNACMNPNTAVVQPGSFGVIWLWTDDTITVDTKRTDVALGMPQDVAGTNVYHAAFRQHYNMPMNNDVPIVALYGTSLTKGTRTHYALVMDKEIIGGDTSENFQIATPTFTVSYDTEGKPTYSYPANNNNILCMWEWGTATGAGLGASSDKNLENTSGIKVFTPSDHQGKATIFVPPSCSPDYYNYKMKAENDEFVAKEDYVDIDGLYVYSYREMAIFSGVEAPTLGYMDAIQWAYVDPDRCPDSVKTSTGATGTQTWQEAALAAYIAAHPVVFEEDGGNRTETAIKITFKDRSELGNKGQNQAATTVTAEKKVPVIVWILIGVGALVLVGAVVVVVILVLKKKKAVAADDVAAEGEVLIVDETAGAAPQEASSENNPPQE